MSDKIVVMADGEIQQVGTPEEIYNEPANVFVADFIGESNIFNGVMEDNKCATFADALFQTVDDFPKGVKIDAVIRPEDVEVVAKGEGQIDGVVTSSDFKGTFYITFVQCGQYEMEVHCLKQYKEGDEVGLFVAPDMIHIIKYDDTLNHYEGAITSVLEDNEVSISFADITTKLSIDKVIPNATVTNGVINDEKGGILNIDTTKLDVYFDPCDGVLSDNVDAGDVSGTIVSFYYIGDHYSYTVRSESENDYVVDDEYLYNQGDKVSIKIKDGALKISVEGE